MVFSPASYTDNINSSIRDAAHFWLTHNTKPGFSVKGIFYKVKLT